MKKILALALVGLVASSASAVELSLVGDDDDQVTVALSTTGTITVQMVLDGGADGNVSFMNAFMDAAPFNEGTTDGYTVEGNVFKMERDDGSPWFRNAGGANGPNIEDYSLIAADDEGGGGPGTNGAGTYAVDNIIIHGTDIGVYHLYYENGVTAEGAPRPPGVFDLNNVQKGYAINLPLPGFMFFRNAWVEPAATPPFDVPFIVNVTPEPASLALLAVGGLALLRRRK